MTGTCCSANDLVLIGEGCAPGGRWGSRSQAGEERLVRRRKSYAEAKLKMVELAKATLQHWAGQVHCRGLRRVSTSPGHIMRLPFLGVRNQRLPERQPRHSPNTRVEPGPARKLRKLRIATLAECVLRAIGP
jgi:hypothetical protein